MAATTTMTLGLVLHDAASDPFQSTREATNGPDVVATVMPYSSEPTNDPAERVIDQPAELAALEELASAPGVVDHSGPYPVTTADLEVSGRTADVQAVGRDAVPASVDQPELIQGSWVSDGGVVLEAAFANALEVTVGDPVSLNGQSFDVVGVAITAAMPPYPQSSCFSPRGCASNATSEELSELPPGLLQNPGIVWLTETDLRILNLDPDSLSYVLNLRLAESDEAQAFVDANLGASMTAPGLQTWQEILEEATEHARDGQLVLLFGAWLLGLLAVASVSVMVGGRMADQTRRVGLLKTVGGTPSLVAAVLLAEYVVVALLAAAAGLAIGSLIAPLLVDSGAGLIGSAGVPTITMSTAGLVTALALGVAVVATLVPAVRAARTSTVQALAVSARPPRRAHWLIALSARLPVPLLLALRVAARRPRRVVLGVVSIAITVSGIVVALAVNAELTTMRLAGRFDDSQAEMLGQVLLIVMVILFSLATLNAIFITLATVLDNRVSSALVRALGASPGEVSSALSAAQVLPALVGAILSIPGSIALFTVINAMNDNGNNATLPPLWQLVAVMLATVLVVAVLTAIPARIGARHPVAETLRNGFG